MFLQARIYSSYISTICKKKKIKPLIFGQHRCHSTYLAFGGNIIELIDELLGRETGCTKAKVVQRLFTLKILICLVMMV